ncbi:hypothetical protein PGTUg99_014387 [Puccinia graminis f. sp. tritici]|uniref:Uncharacterized protein n=1 Tax=Puccinia graminis f. sp. tritici TaxID=56615 RepID=A0A5B0NSZ4_PUCGR|nr:hypothetical protein PGTUg99_014387 [Puccinia graminis f. sp. tritici]
MAHDHHSHQKQPASHTVLPLPDPAIQIHTQQGYQRKDGGVSYAKRPFMKTIPLEITYLSDKNLTTKKGGIIQLLDSSFSLLTCTKFDNSATL